MEFFRGSNYRLAEKYTYVETIESLQLQIFLRNFWDNEKSDFL